MTEIPFVFPCRDKRLIGILHDGESRQSRGVVILTGGPQYRVGGHRQQVALARRLSTAGYPTLRFDFRGTGDADGDTLDFDTVDAYHIVGEDLGAAIAALHQRCPGVRDVVLWGLCSAATAIMIHAARHPSVVGIISINPWVRSKVGIARTTLRHYYVRKLLDAAFWQRTLRGEIHLRPALSEFAGTLARAVFAGRNDPSQAPEPATACGSELANSYDQRLLVLAAAGLRRYKGRGLLILSGNDLTAAEFSDGIRKSREWRDLLASERWQRSHLADADHTFSNEAQRTEVADRSISWLRSW